MWMYTTRVHAISLLVEMPWGVLSGGAQSAPPDAVENPGWAPRSGAENPGQLHVSREDAAYEARRTASVASSNNDRENEVSTTTINRTVIECGGMGCLWCRGREEGG
ncbi:hypothetical protein K525DRAFT_252072 [Schizophyllum commune Loenen D]|nr:hypothetical protein K525DRAFT_252072 [Schizophyllum commune Loenen D]